MCSMLISPCLPPLLRDLSVLGLPVTLVSVCVWLWGHVGRLQTDLLSPLSSLRLSVYGSMVKSMVSCCSGCVLLPFLPLWACCCQIKPSTAPSDAFSLKCVVTKNSYLLVYLTVHLLISSLGSSLLAPLCISLSGRLVRFLVCLVGGLLSSCKTNLIFNF